MSARLVPMLLSCCALAAGPYVPDLSRWRLELSAPPGGCANRRRSPRLAYFSSRPLRCATV